MGLWKLIQDANEAEVQATKDAREVGRGIVDGVRAAVKSYQHDKRNEEQAQAEGGER